MGNIDPRRVDWDRPIEAEEVVCIRRTRGWYAEDGYGHGDVIYYRDAASAREAAEAYADPAAYDPKGEGCAVRVHVWRRVVGHTADGRRVRGTYGWRSITVHLPPDEDMLCDRAFREAGEEPEPGHEHEWMRPLALVGGIDSAPGVQGSPGVGVAVTEVCRCGLERVSYYGPDGLRDMAVTWRQEVADYFREDEDEDE